MEQKSGETGEAPFDAVSATDALRLIRKRRWYLGGVVIAYMPAMSLTLRVWPTYRAVGIVYAVWFVLLLAAGIYSALARCPRCGNYFHMHGMTLLYLRKCLHCQLHITADKKEARRRRLARVDG